MVSKSRTLAPTSFSQSLQLLTGSRFNSTNTIFCQSIRSTGQSEVFLISVCDHFQRALRDRQESYDSLEFQVVLLINALDRLKDDR